MTTAIVLDASAALSWLIKRIDPNEARISDEILNHLRTHDALVPALWYPEVANGVLIAERRNVVDPVKSGRFLATIEQLPIAEDPTRASAVQGTVLALARSSGLTSYDATYLELVSRTGLKLATFDRKLANAVRNAGGEVFGFTHP